MSHLSELIILTNGTAPYLYPSKTLTTLPLQGERDETNKVDESTAEKDAEDLYEVPLNFALSSILFKLYKQCIFNCLYPNGKILI